MAGLAGLLQTNSPTRMMASVSSAIGMNVDGGTDPSAGWFHRSSASTPMMLAAGELDLGLVGEVQLATVERSPELGREGQLLGGAVVERPAESLGPVATSFLGGIHGVVGVADEVGWPAPGGPSGDADRCRDPDHGGGEFGSARTTPARTSSTRRCTCESPAISAMTTNSSPPNLEQGRSLGDGCADPACDLEQDGVADVVTEAVVDQLEPVEVDEQHRHATRRGPDARSVPSASPSRSRSKRAVR